MLSGVGLATLRVARRLRQLSLRLVAVPGTQGKPDLSDEGPDRVHGPPFDARA